MKLQTKKKHTSSCFEGVVTIEIFISINILSKYTQFVHCKMYSEIKILAYGDGISKNISCS